MNNMKFCDLHTHVLPGVDDGAPTMEYALQMLNNALCSDVEMLAVTPHCNIPFTDGNYLDQRLKDRFLQLQQAARDIPIRLVLGAEVRVSDDMISALKAGKLPTLNGGRYLLTEFAADTAEHAFRETLERICECKYIPLIAHPERYLAVCENPFIVADWLDMGCHLQLTGGSVMGEYGKTIQRTAEFLLRQDFVACIASDAHGLNGRSNFLLDVYDHLTVHYSKQYARYMMHENPLHICYDEAI